MLAGGYLISALTVGALWLAWSARRSRRDRPVWGALLLGPEDQDASTTDLRFATFVAAVLILVMSVVLFPALTGGAAVGELLFAAVLALPVTACGLAVLADGLGRCLPFDKRSGRSGSSRSTTFEGDPLHPLEDQPEVELIKARALLESAMDGVRDDVQEAIDGDDQVLALEALSEAVVEYGKALEHSGRVTRTGVQSRIEGVMTLATSCMSSPALCAETEALATLGLAPGATPLEAERVYRVLRELYAGSGALPGVDPERVEALDKAWELLRRDAEENEAFDALTTSGGFDAIDFDLGMLTTTARARRAA